MEIFPGECPSLGKFSVCCELCTGEINWTSKNDKWILGFFCPPFGPYFQSHHIIIWSSWTGTWLIQCCVLEKPIETPVRAILGVRHHSMSRFIVIWIFGLSPTGLDELFQNSKCQILYFNFVKNMTGPLNCMNPATQTWELCGVVSWGARCAEPGSISTIIIFFSSSRFSFGFNNLKM